MGFSPDAQQRKPYILSIETDTFRTTTMNAREIYTAYVAAATAANVKVKAFSSFKNKTLIQEALDALKPAPRKGKSTVVFSGKKATTTMSLTKVERARLRRWQARHGIGHVHNRRYITEQLSIEALIAIGHVKPN